MLDAYLYDGLRSPIGRHAGALATVRPDDLLAGVMKDLMAPKTVKRFAGGGYCLRDIVAAIGSGSRIG
jgi:acetyl-CoA acetyltransferase